MTVLNQDLERKTQVQSAERSKLYNLSLETSWEFGERRGTSIWLRHTIVENISAILVPFYYIKYGCFYHLVTVRVHLASH